MKNMKNHSIASLGRGTYILILRLHRDQKVQIGEMGSFEFPSGMYAYVGSAFGPGGLAARLQHHLNRTNQQRWHIDYLRPVTELEQVLLTEEKTRREHHWAALLHTLSCATVVVERFGSSDCKCATHLYFLQNVLCIKSIIEQVQNRFPGDVIIQNLKIKC
ncbi:MAG: DUF123 domain-containing protein [bacterium]